MLIGSPRRRLLLVASLLVLAAAESALGKRVWNRFALEGKTFNESSAFETEVVPDACTCRKRCFVRRKCKSWTAFANDKRQIECRYAENGPIQNTPHDRPNALYGFTEDGLEGLIQEGSDGALYFVHTRDRLAWAGSWLCSKVPGFRLAIFRSRQQLDFGWDMARRAGGDLRINLTYRDGRLVWGDGTPCSDDYLRYLVRGEESSSYPLVLTAASKLATSEERSFVLCQRDVELGVI